MFLAAEKVWVDLLHEVVERCHKITMLTAFRLTSISALNTKFGVEAFVLGAHLYLQAY